MTNIYDAAIEDVNKKISEAEGRLRLTQAEAAGAVAKVKEAKKSYRELLKQRDILTKFAEKS
jgi:hypothetical protein